MQMKNVKQKNSPIKFQNSFSLRFKREKIYLKTDT